MISRLPRGLRPEAFGCSGLKNVELGDFAFKGCSLLVTLTVPAGYELNDETAFDHSK
jgi:hypothetical protein